MYLVPAKAVAGCYFLYFLTKAVKNGAMANAARKDIGKRKKPKAQPEAQSFPSHDDEAQRPLMPANRIKRRMVKRKLRKREPTTFLTVVSAWAGAVVLLADCGCFFFSWLFTMTMVKIGDTTKVAIIEMMVGISPNCSAALVGDDIARIKNIINIIMPDRVDEIRK